MTAEVGAEVTNRKIGTYADAELRAKSVILSFLIYVKTGEPTTLFVLEKSFINWTSYSVYCFEEHTHKQNWASIWLCKHK